MSTYLWLVTTIILIGGAVAGGIGVYYYKYDLSQKEDGEQIDSERSQETQQLDSDKANN